LSGRIIPIAILLAALTAGAGCVAPGYNLESSDKRTAIYQQGIADAAREALEKPKIEALTGQKVWVDVSCISSAKAQAESSDGHFIKNLVIETLVESGVDIVERAQAEAILHAQVEVLGIDTVARIFPHPWLAVMYHISYTARVKIHLFSYDKKDSQPIAVADCEGTHSWSELSILGFGPFR